MKPVADALGVSRSNLIEQLSAEPQTKRWRRRDDEDLLKRIRGIVDERGSYGYRRTTRLVNRQLAREALPTVNHKRVYRIMREHQLLLQR